jgi:hypothetical protein
MKSIKILFLGLGLILGLSVLIVSCQKDVAPTPAPAPPPPPTSLSFLEEFDDVSDLAAKGWVIKNNSNPIGSNAWGQGRYENNLGGSKAGKVIGMPAYSSSKSPYDFISVDATCVNSKGEVNCWLITPQTTIKNGDVLSFYTKAMNDQDWSNFAKDRLQVRANIIDGSIDCGTTGSDFGKFTELLTDINATYANNDPAGYPQVWTKRTITINIPSLTTPKKARFAFRYLCDDGGLSGAKASSLVGIDQLIFKSN